MVGSISETPVETPSSAYVAAQFSYVLDTLAISVVVHEYLILAMSNSEGLGLESGKVGVVKLESAASFLGSNHYMQSSPLFVIID